MAVPQDIEGWSDVHLMFHSLSHFAQRFSKHEVPYSMSYLGNIEHQAFTKDHRRALSFLHGFC